VSFSAEILSYTHPLKNLRFGAVGQLYPIKRAMACWHALRLFVACTIEERNGPSALLSFTGSATPFIIRNALNMTGAWDMHNALSEIGNLNITAGPPDQIVYLDGTGGKQVPFRDYIEEESKQVPFRDVIFDSSSLGLHLLETLRLSHVSAEMLSKFSVAFNRSSSPKPSELQHSAEDEFVSNVASIGAGIVMTMHRNLSLNNCPYVRQQKGVGSPFTGMATLGWSCCKAANAGSCILLRLPKTKCLQLHCRPQIRRACNISPTTKA
jgi:hypothetical protein